MKFLDIKTIKRVNVKKNASDGEYNGEIKKVYVFETDKGKNMLGLAVDIIEENCLIQLSQCVPFEFFQGSMFSKIVDGLGMLPDINEDLNIDDLVGIKVHITVRNKYKDGNQYSNIVEIRRSHEEVEKGVESFDVEEFGDEYNDELEFEEAPIVKKSVPRARPKIAPQKVTKLS